MEVDLDLDSININLSENVNKHTKTAHKVYQRYLN
jgi:hypothetical protein